MDFFARQDQARRNTKLLVFYFILAVALITMAVYFATLVIFQGANTYRHQGLVPDFTLWNPKLFLLAAGGTIAVIAGGSLFKTAQLSSGGSAVAESLGGRLVDSNTNEPDERKLLNVVEEMAIASGVPTPQVYLLDREDGINAFAAGHTPNDAAIGVTRGCIANLKRDELQGVIGHEFSHILNGDMRLNLRLMGIIFGIVCLTVVGRLLLNTRGGNSRDRNPLPLLGLALVILGWVGVFFAQLIQAAVSRQREFLADASAVQFTRHPEGLSKALQKIGAVQEGSRLATEHAQEASHMFFSNAMKLPFFDALATHPPLAERIQAIDPNWDGKFAEAASVLDVENETMLIQTGKPGTVFPPIIPGFSGNAGSHGITAAISMAGVLPSLGKPSPLHLRYAVEFRESLPESVRIAARNPDGATALLYALLLSEDESIRSRQIQELAARVIPSMQERVVALWPTVGLLAQRTRLPLVNLALPALRQLPADAFQDFNRNLIWLIESDGQIVLFEFVLQKIIQRQIEPHFNRARPAATQYYSIRPLVPDCTILLSALAHTGQSSPDAVAQAFQTGLPYLRANDATVALLPRDECGLTPINLALDRLAQAVPQIKRNLLEACIQVIGADGVIQESEAELLRGIAETIDCPMPPFVTMA